MKRVTGLGGVFFKAQNPKTLQEWYVKHLGLPATEYGTTFQWREEDNPDQVGQTTWCLFPQDTDYFNPSKSPFMINYRVADLDGLLAVLREEGVAVEDRIESYPYGRFAWITDPEGNRIELWEPTEEDSETQ